MPGAPGYIDPGMRFASVGSGLRTEYGSIIPPGGQVVAYVHHSGPARLPGAAPGMPPVYTTLNAALKLCNSGYGDTVIVLPGHAENISTADQMSNLVAGTRIIGVGNGNNRPTFTWTAATATFLLDVANVRLENLRLHMSPDSGTVSVAAPITISAAGCQIVGCVFRASVDVNSKATIPVTTTDAADDLLIHGCRMYGATAGESTTGFRFVGADRLEFYGNMISIATSAVAIGPVQFLTTASTDIKMFDNVIRNNKAASTAAVTGLTGTSGEVDDLLMGTLGNAAAQLILGNAAGAWAGNADGMMFGLNVGVVNLAGESAARATPLSA
jgi:hypothetical protein